MAISVRLSPETEQMLDHLARLTGRAKSHYLRELVEGGLDDLEDFYLADADMERVGDLTPSGVPVISRKPGVARLIDFVGS